MSRLAFHYCNGGADRSRSLGTRAACLICQKADLAFRAEDHAKRLLNHEHDTHKRCVFKGECQCGCEVCDPKGNK